MRVLATARLRLRPMAPGDAPFILALLNEPSFIQNIADKGVRTLGDARNYIISGPMVSYERMIDLPQCGGKNRLFST